MTTLQHFFLQHFFPTCSVCGHNTHEWTEPKDDNILFSPSSPLASSFCVNCRNFCLRVQYIQLEWLLAFLKAKKLADINPSVNLAFFYFLSKLVSKWFLVAWNKTLESKHWHTSRGSTTKPLQASPAACLKLFPKLSVSMFSKHCGDGGSSSHTDSLSTSISAAWHRDGLTLQIF